MSKESCAVVQGVFLPSLGRKTVSGEVLFSLFRGTFVPWRFVSEQLGDCAILIPVFTLPSLTAAFVVTTSYMVILALPLCPDSHLELN